MIPEVEKLMPFQRQGVAFAVHTCRGRAMIADEMGMKLPPDDHNEDASTAAIFDILIRKGYTNHVIITIIVLVTFYY